jgi:hypothetical protein
VEGTPRSHAWGSSTDFDDISQGALQAVAVKGGAAFVVGVFADQRPVVLAFAVGGELRVLQLDRKRLVLFVG